MWGSCSYHIQWVHQLLLIPRRRPHHRLTNSAGWERPNGRATGEKGQWSDRDHSIEIGQGKQVKGNNLTGSDSFLNWCRFAEGFLNCVYPKPWLFPFIISNFDQFWGVPISGILHMGVS